MERSATPPAPVSRRTLSQSFSVSDKRVSRQHDTIGNFPEANAGSLGLLPLSKRPLDCFINKAKIKARAEAPQPSTKTNPASGAPPFVPVGFSQQRRAPFVDESHRPVLWVQALEVIFNLFATGF
jgi:hypothetical protein